MSTDRLSVLASTLLSHTVAALTDNNREVPDRRYVSHSEPAWDCEQLTVHLVGLTPKLLGRGDPNVQGRVALVTKAAVGISLVKCAPVPDDAGNPPSPAALNQHALDSLDDGWVIWNYLTRLWIKGSLLPPAWPTVVSRADPPVTFDSLTLVGPSGQYAGVKQVLSVVLPNLRSEVAGT